MIAMLGSDDVHVTVAPEMPLPFLLRTSAENDTELPDAIDCAVDGVMTTVAGVLSGCVPPPSLPDPPHPPTASSTVADRPVRQRMRISARVVSRIRRCERKRRRSAGDQMTPTEPTDTQLILI